MEIAAELVAIEKQEMRRQREIERAFAERKIGKRSGHISLAAHRLKIGEKQVQRLAPPAIHRLLRSIETPVEAIGGKMHSAPHRLRRLIETASDGLGVEPVNRIGSGHIHAARRRLHGKGRRTARHVENARPRRHVAQRKEGVILVEAPPPGHDAIQIEFLDHLQTPFQSRRPPAFWDGLLRRE
nr:hypothetical protein DBT53_11285 [Aerococcus mictus]